MLVFCLRSNFYYFLNEKYFRTKKKAPQFQFLLLKLIKPGVSGNSLRRATSECCHTDSSPVTGTQNQQPNTQVTQITFGEDESSCDSHTRWGKILIFGEEMRMFVVVFFLLFLLSSSDSPSKATYVIFVVVQFFLNKF